MTFDVAGGGLNDNSCRQGSPNKYLIATNPRPITGFLQEQSGERTTGLTFPRMSISNSPAPLVYASATTYTFTVTNSGTSAYLFTGSDLSNTFNNAGDPTIRCNSGEILEFNLNASGHPFWIKTQPTTGTGFGVTVGTVTNNGTDVGTVTWNTANVNPGTYYYICQYHGSMNGAILVF